MSQERAALAAVAALAPLAKPIAAAMLGFAAAALSLRVAVGVPGLVALKVAVVVLAAPVLMAPPGPVDGPQVAVVAAAALVAAPAPGDGPQVAGLAALAMAAETAATAAITAALLYLKNRSRDSDFSPKREQPRSMTPSKFRY